MLIKERQPASSTTHDLMGPPPAFTSGGHGRHQQRHSSDEEDDGSFAWTDSDSQPHFAPHHVPGDAGASDEELEGPIAVPHRDSASHAFVWAPESRTGDSLNAWMERSDKSGFTSLLGSQSSSQPLASEFVFQPLTKAPPAPASLPPTEPEIPLKDSSVFAFADVTFPSTGGHSPAKIVQSVKSALVYFDALEYTESHQEWRLKVSCLCVAEQIDFSIQLSRQGDDGSTGDRNNFEVSFHRTFGDEARYLALVDCIRSRCREIDDEPLPLVLVPETLEPWFDARQEIAGRSAAIGPKDALELLKQLHADLHEMTLYEVAKEIKDHCRHKGNRKTFYRVDPNSFLSGLRAMLSSSSLEMSRFGVFILLQFAKDHDVNDREDAFSPFFRTPYDKSSFSLLLSDVLGMHEDVACGKFTCEMVQTVRRSWVFA